MADKDLKKGKGKGEEVTYEIDSKDPLVINEARSAYQVERIYTYEDYLNWPEDERIELIDGKIYYMSAPTKRHQELLRRLSTRFDIYLHGKSCDVYFAPFDVRIDLDLGKDSVVQPDLVGICDDEKLDEKGLNGAPDLVIEVLSKSTASKDRLIKYHKYLSVGVKEYWLVDPTKEEVIVNVLKGNTYEAIVYVKGEMIKPTILTDLSINVTELFDGRKDHEIVEVEVAREEEREKGKAEKREIAKNLLSSNIPIDIIANSTQLSKADILELQSEV